MHSPALIVDTQGSQNDNARAMLFSTKCLIIYWKTLWWPIMESQREIARQRKISVTMRMTILQVLRRGDSRDLLTVWSTPRGTWDSLEGKCNNSMTRRGCQLQSAQDRGPGSDTLKTAAFLDSPRRAFHQWAASPLEIWEAMWESKQYRNCEW